MENKTPITIEATVAAPLEKVWAGWTEPSSITQWCTAGDDWHAPRAENDLRVGGVFVTRMEAKDGSAGFDFGGTYTAVEPQAHLEYLMSDGRKVSVKFLPLPGGVKIIETFDPEQENSEEMQKAGWQSILNNFKKYAEANL